MKMKLKMFLSVVLLTAGLSAAAQAQEGSHFTKVNIWYEKPEKIMSTNYHKGAILPIGTEVEILKSGRKEIKFREKETGTKFRIVLVKNYTDLNEQEFFDRYFSKENILNSAEYTALSDMEKKNIKEGTLQEGMSKKAVLMAYGYPPSHRTPSTAASAWTYWKSRVISFMIEFDGDKLEDIND